MEKTSLLLIVALATVAMFSVQVSATAAAVDDDDDAPPMYAAHDYASGELQKRRTIKANQPCDAEFGTDLEAVVTEMEKNKDANEELANKLRKQFEALMEKNKEKNLCEKLTWCDMGVCRKRVKIQSRGLEEGGAAAPAADATATKTDAAAPKSDSAADAAPNSAAKEVRHGHRHGHEDEKTATEKSKSGAAREVMFLFSSIWRWAVLTVITILIPRSL